jgi:hypothetical protein
MEEVLSVNAGVAAGCSVPIVLLWAALLHYRAKLATTPPSDFVAVPAHVEQDDATVGQRRGVVGGAVGGDAVVQVTRDSAALPGGAGGAPFELRALREEPLLGKRPAAADAADSDPTAAPLLLPALRGPTPTAMAARDVRDIVSRAAPATVKGVAFNAAAPASPAERALRNSVVDRYDRERASSPSPSPPRRGAPVSMLQLMGTAAHAEPLPPLTNPFARMAREAVRRERALDAANHSQLHQTL